MPSIKLLNVTIIAITISLTSSKFTIDEVGWSIVTSDSYYERLCWHEVYRINSTDYDYLRRNELDPIGSAILRKVVDPFCVFSCIYQKENVWDSKGYVPDPEAIDNFSGCPEKGLVTANIVESNIRIIRENGKFSEKVYQNIRKDLTDFVYNVIYKGNMVLCSENMEPNLCKKAREFAKCFDETLQGGDYFLRARLKMFTKHKGLVMSSDDGLRERAMYDTIWREEYNITRANSPLNDYFPVEKIPIDLKKQIVLWVENYMPDYYAQM